MSITQVMGDNDEHVNQGIKPMIHSKLWISNGRDSTLTDYYITATVKTSVVKTEQSPL